MSLTCHPLTPDRWPDLDALFGTSGAYGGCWCMWWRITRAEFDTQHGAGNRRAMQRLVDGGTVPGILGYQAAEPVAWCSVAPRDQFAALERSPVLKRLDDEPVWSIVCFYLKKSVRGLGLTGALIDAAVEHAGRNGARVVEAYPTVPRGRRLAPVSSFMGLPDMFAAAGFVECAQPSASRRIMRRTLHG